MYYFTYAYSILANTNIKKVSTENCATVYTTVYTMVMVIPTMLRTQLGPLQPILISFVFQNSLPVLKMYKLERIEGEWTHSKATIFCIPKWVRRYGKSNHSIIISSSDIEYYLWYQELCTIKGTENKNFNLKKSCIVEYNFW